MALEGRCVSPKKAPPAGSGTEKAENVCGRKKIYTDECSLNFPSGKSMIFYYKEQTKICSSNIAYPILKGKNPSLMANPLF